MIVTIFGGLIIAWIIFMIILFSPQRFYSDAWDKLRSGRGQPDRINLQIMIDNLRSYPEQWQISRDGASYPKEGAKKIYLSKDRSGDWQYTLDSIDSQPRALVGHYEQQFKDELKSLNDKFEREALLRTFYKDLEGPLMIGDRSCYRS